MALGFVAPRTDVSEWYSQLDADAEQPRNFRGLLGMTNRRFVIEVEGTYLAVGKVNT